MINHKPVDEDGNVYIAVRIFPKVEELLNNLRVDLTNADQEHLAQIVPIAWYSEQVILNGLEKLRDEMLRTLTVGPDRAKLLAQVVHIEIIIKEA